MKIKNLFIAFILILINFQTYSQSNPTWGKIISSAYLENHSYEVLEKICDEAGGRLLGSNKNIKAISILSDELSKMNLHVAREKFSVPGWVRGNDEVTLLNPVDRKLKAIALGYVNKTPEFTADLVYAKYGMEENYLGLDVKGKIVLVTQEAPPHQEGIFRSEAIEIAAKNGAIAILFIDNREGGLCLAGVSNFQGNPAKIPAFSLTLEEGKWLMRLSDKNESVKIKIKTDSFCKNVQTENVVLTFPGEVKDKIVVGAHIDAWDLGQGGIDNGLGTAILFDLARILNDYSKENYYTIELVWFNGEELGLWGSKKYLEMHKKDKIIAMINLDMTGTPTGFNAMGFDEFVPVLKNIKNRLNGFDLKDGVISSPGTNSDHMPFMFEGIPTLSLLAHLDENMYKYYHESGDSFDKVNKKYLSDATAIVSILVTELSNNKEFKFRRRTKKEMAELLENANLKNRLIRQGEWKF